MAYNGWNKTMSFVQQRCRCQNNSKLFGVIGYTNKWASRITDLLLVQVDETDLPSFQSMQVVHTSFRVPEKDSCKSSVLQGGSPTVYEHMPVMWTLETYKGNQ